MTVNDELGRIRKESDMTFFAILTHSLLVRTEESHGTPQ